MTDLLDLLCGDQVVIFRALTLCVRGRARCHLERATVGRALSFEGPQLGTVFDPF